MIITNKLDYKDILLKLKHTANEVNDTYEEVGISHRFIGTTNTIKEMFNISDGFERDFIKAITEFDETTVGPYITEKYFMLIPALKKAMRQLKDDCYETRRCIIQFPDEHCFQSMQFLIRENTVHVVCYMRSCNAVKNLPVDLWLCSKMADIFKKYIADTVGEHLYEYHAITMMFGSLHVFKEDLNVF